MGVLESGEFSDQCVNVQALLYVIRIQLAGCGALLGTFKFTRVRNSHSHAHIMRAVCLWG
jgi:hypothetical protein